MHTLAIDIGGTKVTLGVFCEEQLIERKRIPTDRNGGPSWMLNAIEVAAQPWIEKYGIRRCGIGFGGPVDFSNQKVKRLHVDAVMDRDTMVGALGEGRYGAGVGKLPLFYMTISTGIGGGLLTESGLFRGSDSFSCEIGHHTIQFDGPECLCGSRGCLERYCAGIWLEQDHGKPADVLMQDPAFVQQYVQHLAQGLKTAIMLLNPARIVIGGGISKAGDALFVPLRSELGRQITAWSKATVDVVPAALGDDTILWGALALTK
jgi:glucokinase